MTYRQFEEALYRAGIPARRSEMALGAPLLVVGVTNGRLLRLIKEAAQQVGLHWPMDMGAPYSNSKLIGQLSRIERLYKNLELSTEPIEELRQSPIFR
jgi:hypothetical protein